MKDRERKKKCFVQVFCGNAAGMQYDLDIQIGHLYRQKKGKDEKSSLKIFITL